MSIIKRSSASLNKVLIGISALFWLSLPASRARFLGKATLCPENYLSLHLLEISFIHMGTTDPAITLLQSYCHQGGDCYATHLCLHSPALSFAPHVLPGRPCAGWGNGRLAAGFGSHSGTNMG